MKKLLVILIIILLGIIAYLYFKPEKKPKQIIIPSIEYRDSPVVDSFKKSIKPIEVRVINWKDSLKKYIANLKPVIRDSIVHDTVYRLQSEIIESQDSIICLKDSIIVYLTDEIKLTRDKAYYFQSLYQEEKGKTKRWKRISLGSILLNGILILKK